ncbi:MAG: ABC transporter permease [Thermoprotei archaeon]
MSLRSFVLRRLGTMLAVLVVVAAINFFLFQVLPFYVLHINPEQWFVPLPSGSVHNVAYIEKVRAQVIAAMGFDLPLYMRFLVYLRSMFTFNFGYNVGGALSGPVATTIERFAPYTILLLGSSTVASYLIGIYLGVVSAAKRGQLVDVASFTTLLFLYAMPSFWIGTLLLVFFAFSLKLFPIDAEAYFSSFHGIAFVGALLKSMVLPFSSLLLISIGGVYLIMRSTTIDVMSEDYIMMARAKGLPNSTILYKHALRNAILPIITLFALSMGFILSGAVITETIFSWPGLGYWTFVAIETLDFPLEQAIFFVISIMVVAANFIADLLYGFLDPRIRAG